MNEFQDSVEQLPESHSVTEMLVELAEGNVEEASAKLWERYITRLIVTARRKIGSKVKHIVDEEDVASRAFNAFIRGHVDGRFSKLEDRDDLWRLLSRIVRNKAVDLVRKEEAQKRGGENRALELNEMRDAVNNRLNGNAIELFTLSVRETLEELKCSLRPVAELRLEGYRNHEIAEKLDISEKSVERKVTLIRKALNSSLAS